MEIQTRISKSSLHGSVKTGALLRQDNSVKRYLTDQNKIDRLEFALDRVGYFSRQQKHEFKTINVVHIDQKWFRIMKERETFSSCKR